jgi:hypothetical protein
LVLASVAVTTVVAIMVAATMAAAAGVDTEAVIA